MAHLFPEHIKPCSAMVFVDGENLAIRWQRQIGDRERPPHVRWERDVYVWSELLNMRHHQQCDIIRRHYYTSAPGDVDRRNRVVDGLKACGLEAPSVFPRVKGKGSKRVDITLSVDMLAHAYQRNYDAAVLVAGDEDYVPLVAAVKNAGRRVFLWFVESGLSPSLKRAADYYFNLTSVLCDPEAGRFFT